MTLAVVLVNREPECPYEAYGFAEVIENQDDPDWELPEACRDELHRQLDQVEREGAGR